MIKLLLSITLFLGLAACKIPRIEEKRNLSLQDIVLSEKLQDKGKFWAAALNFRHPKAFTFTYGSEGIYWHNSGEYTIESDKIQLKATVCKEHDDAKAPKLPCDQTFGNGYCFIDDSFQDIEIALFLTCKSPNPKSFGFATSGIHFQLLSTKRAVGSVITIANKKVKYLGRKKGIVTETVNIRIKPDITSHKNPYFPTNEQNGEFLDAVPMGTKISILGKTMEKDTVKKWVNYWYLVEVGHNDRAWLFGEFVKELDP